MYLNLPNILGLSDNGSNDIQTNKLKWKYTWLERELTTKKHLILYPFTPYLFFEENHDFHTIRTAICDEM